MSERVLVIAAHQDDETLGCGATLLRHRSKGDFIHWLLLNQAQEEHGYSQDEVAKRAMAVDMVSNAYHFDSVSRLCLTPMLLDAFPMSRIIGEVEKAMRQVRPSIVYMPFCGDVHSDHRRAFEVAVACTKTFRNPCLRRTLMMETISETEFAPQNFGCFSPNVFMNISEYLERKIEIMNLYKTEINNPPFPRSESNIRAIATFRGACAGFEYAEAFMLLKEVAP